MPDQPFFSHLKAQLAHHVLIVGETDDFDNSTLDLWSSESFTVTYVPLGETSHADFTRRLRSEADRVVGVSERYIIIVLMHPAFQDAADSVLSLAKTSIPRLVGIIAYYPSKIPDPTRTTYPPGLHIILHTCETSIRVERRPEVLGIQGKPRIVEKQMPSATGVGQEVVLKSTASKRSVVEQGDFRIYHYSDCETGFAEADLDEFDEVARDLAWSRDLRLARNVFGIVDEYSLEGVRDRFVDEVQSSKVDPGLVKLEVNGRRVTEHASEYYSSIASQAILLSRTTGADQVVDELKVTLVNGPASWMGGKPADDNAKEIRIVSISLVRAQQIVTEKVCWHYI